MDIKPLTFPALAELRALDIPARIRHRQYDLPKSTGRPFDAIIRAAESELSSCEDQIAKLQCLLIDLRHNRNELKELIVVSRSVSAPVRKLPTEVLGVIFKHYVHKDFLPPNDTNSSRFLDLDMLKIGWICSHWRAVALSHRSLWSQVTVIWSDRRGGRGEASILSDVLKVLLKRSGEASLRITLIDLARQARLTPDHPVFLALSDQCHRWQDASLRVSRPVLQALRQMPILRTLQLQVDGPGEETVDVFASAKMLGRATFFSDDLHKVRLPEDVHTIVMSHFSRSLSDMAASCAQYSKLTTLCLRAYDTCDIQTPNIIVAPSVQVLMLDILRTQEGAPFLRNFFASFTLSGLKDLRIESTENQVLWHRTGSVDDWPAKTFSDFCIRSGSPIRHLSLVKVSGSVPSMVASFRALPSLVSLIIADRPAKPLITTELVTALTVGTHIFDTPLLPRLTKWKMKLSGEREPGTALPEVSDIVQALTSRWRPSATSSSMVACLGSFEIIGPQALVEGIANTEEVRSICRAGLNFKSKTT